MRIFFKTAHFSLLPMPGNNSGPSRTRAIEPRYRPPGQREILDEGQLREGGTCRRPFGARSFA